MRVLLCQKCCWVTSQIWNFELFRSKCQQNYPELHVRASASPDSRVAALWWFIEQAHSTKIHILPGQKTSCYPFFSTKNSCVWTKLCTVCPTAEGSLSSDVKVYHDVTTIHKELQLMPCEVGPSSTLSLLGTSQSERQKQGQRSGLCIILFRILQTP